MRTCPNCREECPDHFNFCGICGTALVVRGPRKRARKAVTVVFSDLRGSTALGERLDSESLWEVLRTYFEAMRSVLERHGGTVEKYIGDAIMAVFGLPQAHEDDALRAVRAAFEMRLALVEVNEQLRAGWGVSLENRTGVCTGEVVTGDPSAGQRLVTGDTVNLAARLEQAAPSNEVLIAESTYRLVSHAVSCEAAQQLDVKGKAETVDAYRLLAVHGSDGFRRRVDTPLVGRDDAMAALLGRFQRALDGPSCQLATIVGPAGIGKSRVVAELTRRLDEKALVLRGQCLSYGEGITFWPLAEIFRQAAGIASDDSEASARLKLEWLVGAGREPVAERLASMLGLSDEVFGLDETLWGVRSALEAVSRRRPLVVVVDDVHWAEETLLDLIENLIDGIRDAPLFVVCGTRPELYARRASFGSERPHAERVELAELSFAETSLVAQHLLGGRLLPEALELRLLEAADGNPLFVEQMVAMLFDEGALVEGRGDRWELAHPDQPINIPRSVKSLIDARIDRLEPGERRVLEAGSVIGHVFYPAAVREVVDDAGDDLELTLAALAGKRLVAATESDLDLSGADAFRFVHILVRDAAYARLLKRSRADMHRRFGDWLAKLAGQRLGEYEEIVGYHLEQAFGYAAELGTPSAGELAVARRAAGHLRAVGERALGRGDMPAAANLLRRAADLLGDDDVNRPALLVEVGDALGEMGQLEQAGQVLEDAVKRALQLGDEALARTASLVRLQLAYSTDPQGERTRVLDEVERSIRDFEAIDNHEVLERAWRLLLRVHWADSLFGAAERAIEQTVSHARASGHPLRARRTIGALALCAMYGPRPVPAAIERCEEVLASCAEDRKATALAQCAVARLEAMRGNFDRARTLYRSSRGLLEEFGWSFLAALTSIDSGPIEVLAGDLVAAEAELRRDYESLEAMQERNYIATIAALLAGVLYEQGRLAEAGAMADHSAELGDEDDVTTQVAWRSVKAKLLARGGAGGESVDLARQAVAMIDQTDYIDAQASARVDLALVYRMVGEEATARTALMEAVELFRRKENTVSASQTEALLDAVSSATQ